MKPDGSLPTSTPGSSGRFIHTVARSQHPAYPSRASVPDEMVPWEAEWGDYAPVEHTDPVVFANDCTVKPNGWADPADVSKVGADDWNRRLEAGPIEFTDGGVPRNPIGRTGMRGRGLLGKWGPNYTADPLVTRWHPGDGKRLQMVAIRRRDTGDWAIPGGMVDAGEHVSVTVKREFAEEAGNISDPKDKETFERLAKELFAGGSVIYKGYVDEPRNTDNAWIETTVFHYHCGPELGRLLPLEAGDDAAAVRWFDITGDASENKLYPPHRAWVSQLASRLIGSRQDSSEASLQSGPASVVSYVLSPSLSEPLLRRSFRNFDKMKRGYLTVDQLAAIYSDPRGSLLYSEEEAMREANQVIATFAKVEAGKLTYDDFVRWWEAATTAVPRSAWISDSRAPFTIVPSLSECERISDESGGVARLVVSREDEAQRIRLSTVSGERELTISLDYKAAGGRIAHLTKLGLPVATVWRAKNATAFTVYAAMADVQEDGSSTCPVLYSCDGADSDGCVKIIDARSRLVATVEQQPTRCSITVEPQFDASILIGVLIASHVSRGTPIIL